MDILNLILTFFIMYFRYINSFLVFKGSSKLQEFNSMKHYEFSPNPLSGNQNLSPESIVCPSIFPEYIPPYINFSLYTDPKRILPPEVKRHLIWISSLQMVNQVILNTGLSLKSGRSREFNLNTEWIGFFSAKVSKSREPRAVLKHSFQKYNVLPGAEELCHKDKMWYNIQRMAKKFGNGGHDFDFVLETYAFPSEIFQFLKRLTFKKNDEEKWLYKPALTAHSHGFVAFTTYGGQFPTLPRTHKRGIIQRFMSSPYGGRYIRYRLYVLQTSVHPLRLYIYNKGDCILKKTPVSSLDVVIESDQLLSFLKREGHDPVELQGRMEDAILKTILSAQHNMAVKYKYQLKNSYNAYQVWTVDFMFDEYGIPWLTEFNRYISLGLLYEAEAIKIPMITETLNVAGYHFPPTMSNKAQEFVRMSMEKVGNTNPVDFNEKLYSFKRSSRGFAKAKKYSTMFHSGMNRSTYLDSILEDLTEDDVKQLVIAEDELSRTRNYKIIFPTNSTYLYHRFLETSDPYPYMLQDAWESKYGNGNDRARGISVLKNLLQRARTRGRTLHFHPKKYQVTDNTL